jgi:NaMN:DMB phosphoribosyltransferase
MFSFVDAPYKGLIAYENGYVKEGVGAGGTIVATLVKGFNIDDVKRAIYIEYQKLMVEDYVSEYKKN